MMNSFTRHSGAVFAVAVCLAAAACEDEVTAPETQLVEGEIQLDASSTADFTYFSLSDGQVVDVSDAQASQDWDIAFQRFSAKLNGGVAGPAGVAGANLRNNADASAEQVLAFTAADGQAAFGAVTEADISGAQFTTDGLIEDEGGSWFRFSPQVGNLVADPSAAWMVRGADGSFGLFRVAELVMGGQIPASITVEIRHQPAGGTLGPVQAVEVDMTQGPGFVDLSSGGTVPPQGCNWDVALIPPFTIDLNGDCDAGTFPLGTGQDFTAVADASGAAEYGPYLAAISGAIPNTVDSAEGVFWYNIDSNQRMWPTYNVFLVRRGSAVYKVQVTDYYSTTGASGFPTLRYEQLR